jgi:hypothetical protein
MSLSLVHPHAESIDEPELPEPFGRRPVLGILGGTLFAAATRMFVPQPASASHGPPPPGCQGAGECHTCNGSVCTGCDNGPSKNCLLQPGKQCWKISRPANGGCRKIYRCCDWYNSEWGVCICRGYIGTQCPQAVESPAKKESRSRRLH